MKFSFVFWVVFLLCSSFLYAQSIEIKSLKVYGGDNQISLPVISGEKNGTTYITIEFDVQSNFNPNLSILFRFCDMNWVPYNNVFLLNQGKNIAYNLDYDLLPQTVKAAKYHFINSFPDRRGFVTFPFSGKWMFYITDSQDTSSVYAYGKFFVINEDITLRDTIKREQLEDKVYFPADLAKIFNITTDFTIPPNLYPSYVDHIEIVTNHILDYPAIVTRNGNTNTSQYYWNGDRRFSFIARDILPGNEYREADLRNTDKFVGPDVNAQFNGLEYSRFYKQGRRDLNGGSLLTNFNDPYATYLNVTFSIRPPGEVAGDIYLVGAFNNWKISNQYKMKENYGVYSITIQLKRGVYDYQYVIANFNNGVLSNSDWVTLEGNNWDTSNIYYIFLYYKDPNYGGYDKIIGYQLTKSK